MEIQHVFSQSDLVDAVLRQCVANGTNFNREETVIRFNGTVDPTGELSDLGCVIQGPVANEQLVDKSTTKQVTTKVLKT